MTIGLRSTLPERPIFHVLSILLLGLASFAVLASLGGCSCGERPWSSKPTPLLEGFTSRIRQPTVEADLNRRGIAYNAQVEDLGSRDESERPYIKYRSLRIESYVAYGHSGRLYLEFVDDELASTRFWPDRPQEFEETLRNSGIAIDDDEIAIEPATVLSVSRFKPESWHWSDRFLNERIMCWISYYS